MSDDSGKSKKLSLSGGGKLTLGGIEAGAMRASTPGAGRRTVQVEVRRKRAPAAPHRAATPKAEPVAAPPQQAAPQAAPADADDRLTAQERAARVRALQEGMKKPDAAPSEAEAQGRRGRPRPRPDLAETPALLQQAAFPIMLSRAVSTATPPLYPQTGEADRTAEALLRGARWDAQRASVPLRCRVFDSRSLPGHVPTPEWAGAEQVVFLPISAL